MRQYLDLMRHVLEHGARKTDRTGTGTLSTFGWQMRFDLNAGFPLVMPLAAEKSPRNSCRPARIPVLAKPSQFMRL